MWPRCWWHPQVRDRLFSYQVAYDALNPVCAPSQEIVRGIMIEQWFVCKALARRWPVVLPDYEGPSWPSAPGAMRLMPWWMRFGPLALSRPRRLVTVDDLLAVPTLATVAGANRLGGHSLPAPLYGHTGWFDPLTPRDQARALARRYHTAGVTVNFHWLPGKHLLSAVAGTDGAIDDLTGHFNGRAPANECAYIEQHRPAGPAR